MNLWSLLCSRLEALEQKYHRQVQVTFPLNSSCGSSAHICVFSPNLNSDKVEHVLYSSIYKTNKYKIILKTWDTETMISKTYILQSEHSLLKGLDVPIVVWISAGFTYKSPDLYVIWNSNRSHTSCVDLKFEVCQNNVKSYWRRSKTRRLSYEEMKWSNQGKRVSC